MRRRTASLWTKGHYNWQSLPKECILPLKMYLRVLLQNQARLVLWKKSCLRCCGGNTPYTSHRGSPGSWGCCRSTSLTVTSATESWMQAQRKNSSLYRPKPRSEERADGNLATSFCPQDREPQMQRWAKNSSPYCKFKNVLSKTYGLPLSTWNMLRVNDYPKHFWFKREHYR